MKMIDVPNIIYGLMNTNLLDKYQYTCLEVTQNLEALIQKNKRIPFVLPQQVLNSWKTVIPKITFKAEFKPIKLFKA